MTRVKKPTRGGSRPNSGRKPTGVATDQMTITTAKTTIAKIDAAAVVAGLSRNKWVIEACERAIPATGNK